MSYFEAVSAELKDWKKAILVLIFTVARIVYGWAWVEAGWHKLAWLSDGKANAAGKIAALAENLTGPKVHGLDPLHLNSLISWLGTHVFIPMSGLTDTLVVVFEIGVGVLMILGLGIVWAALVALFMNTQFMAGGSFNNFGYIWTNIAMLNFAKYAELIGVSGFLKYRKEKSLSSKK